MGARGGLIRRFGRAAATAVAALCSSVALAQVSLQANLDGPAWLARIAHAAHTLSYTGVFVYQQAGLPVQTARVTHVVEGANSRERFEVLDGVPQIVLRHNGEIKVFHPETKVVSIESRRQGSGNFPALLGNQAQSIGALSDVYRVSKWDINRVAGFDCQVILLEPKDGLRYTHKFWADQQSGLLIKAQTFNEKGEVVEHIAFTQLEFGNAASLDKLLRSRPAAPGMALDSKEWKVHSVPFVEANFAANGWTIGSGGRMPAGYRKLTEVQRAMPESGGMSRTSDAITRAGLPANAGGRAPEAASETVGQIVYSDGLSSVSIFIAPATRPRSKLREFFRENVGAGGRVVTQGATNMVVRRVADYVVTVVGEAPPECILQLAKSIDFKPEKLEK